VKVSLKALYVPLGVTLGLSIGLSWYYFGWVTSRRDYFRKRDFRLLATLSDQIGRKVDNFDSVLDNFSNYLQSERSPTATEKAKYLKILCPDLEYLEANEHSEAILNKICPGDPPGIYVAGDEGTDYLYLALGHSDATHPEQRRTGCVRNASTVYARADIKKLIQPFVTPLVGFFDAIFVAQRDGRIIFQQSQPGIEVTNLSGLRAARGAEKIAMGMLGAAASSGEVTVAGANYIYYSQPTPLSYPGSQGTDEAARQAPSRKGAGPDDKDSPQADAASESEQWIVCGLVRTDAFAKDTLAISSTVILGFGAALLLIICLSPFIKLALLHPRERLRARDGALLSVSSFLCTALVTLIVIDVYYYGLFHGLATQQLKKFADLIQTNFQSEEYDIWNQLGEFEKSADFRGNIDAMGAAHEGSPVKTIRQECHPQEIHQESVVVCERTGILASGEPPLSYPYLESAFWADSEGRERVKWTSEERVTPFLFLPDVNPPYYEDLQRESAWLKKTENGRARSKALPGGVGLLYSVNTGKDIAVFWRLKELSKASLLSTSAGDFPSGGSSTRMLSGAIVTRPVSLIGSALPADFQFAVVDENGLVLFDSDPTKNLIENFFEECDQNAKLRSLVVTQTSGSLYANYQGRREDVYVRPLNHYGEPAGADSLVSFTEASPWSLVVFSDMRPEETMNFEALSSASILLLLLAGLLAVVWVVLSRLWRRSKWYWPDAAKAPTYLLVVILNSLLLASFLFCIIYARPSTAASMGFLIPAAALALAFFLLNYEGAAGSVGVFASTWQRVARRLSQAGMQNWKTMYRWAHVSFMVVVAVLPCLAFFRVTYEFEMMLLIERGQAKLLESLQGRRTRIRSEYERIVLSPENESRIDSTPYASYHSAFFGTQLKIDNGPAGDHAPAREWFGDRWKRFLVHLRLPSDKIALETGARIATETDGTEGKWTLDSSVVPPRLELRTRPEEPGEAFAISSEWDPSPAARQDRLWCGIAIAAALALVYLFLRLAEKIFLLDLYKPMRGRATNLTAPISTNMLVVGLPLSGKTKALVQREALCRDIHRLDLARIARGPDWAQAYDYTALAGKPQLPIVVDHLDYSSRDEAPWSDQKLRFLEKLVYDQGRTLALVSNLEPPLSLDGRRLEVKRTQPARQSSSQNGPCRAGGRWEALLSSFVRRDFEMAGPEQDGEFGRAVEELRLRLSSTNGSGRRARVLRRVSAIVGCFKNECSPAPRLRAIARELVSRLNDDGELSPDAIVAELADEAEGYYERLWATLSEDEQLALAQLAQEGLVNPRNRKVVGQLMRKGLIVRDPTFRLMNQSFRCFVASAFRPDTMVSWEKAGIQRLSWTKLRFVLLATTATVGAFLYITQQSLFQSVIAYVAALAAAIPELMELIGKGRRSPA
jgi:hypothetical protein